MKSFYHYYIYFASKLTYGRFFIKQKVFFKIVLGNTRPRNILDVKHDIKT